MKTLLCLLVLVAVGGCGPKQPTEPVNTAAVPPVAATSHLDTEKTLREQSFKAVAREFLDDAEEGYRSLQKNMTPSKAAAISSSLKKICDSVPEIRYNPKLKEVLDYMLLIQEYFDSIHKWGTRVANLSRGPDAQNKRGEYSKMIKETMEEFPSAFEETRALLKSAK